MTQDEQDKALSALYRRARNAEPRSALDAKLLDEAQRVAAARRRTRRRWMPSLAAAALLVLVAGVSIRVLDQDGVTRSVSPPPPERRESDADTATPAASFRAEPLPPDLAAPAGEGAGSLLADIQATSETPRKRARKAASAKPAAAIAARPRRPAFPFDATLFSRRYPDATVIDVGGHTLQILLGQVQVMVLQRVDARIRIDAWRGASALGVEAPWGSSPAPGTSCRQDAGFSWCDLGEGREGAYRNGDLEFVRWYAD